MTFTANIPKSGESLGSTRARINTNFQEIFSVMAVNHVEFNSLGEGKHKFLQMPVYTTFQAAVPTTGALEGAVYTKNVGAGVTQLFYRKESNGPEAQLTALSFSNNATFGKGSAYGAPPPNVTFQGGWSFLAGNSTDGGIIIQWGKVIVGVTAGTKAVTFPRAFPSSLFSLTSNIIGTTSAPNISLPTASGFSFFADPSTILYWQAIGI